MALPTSDTVWPPRALADISPKLEEWAAWYSGGADDLSRAYGIGDYGQVRPLAQVRPSQFAGGIVGRAARWFWGQPTTAGQQRSKLHIPMAADIATASADLLFSEVPELTFDEGVDQTRLDLILDGNNWSSLLPEAAEVCSALGGVYLRTTWDAEVAAYPLITTMHADQAYPEFRFGRLWAVTFWQILEQHDQTFIRHLERHERGRIEHGLFEGTSDRLGRRIPITEHPATADISVDEESGISTGFEGLTAVYVPNVLPNRKWRTHVVGANLGRADYDGVEPLMDALDETWTSWMRDIRLGKGRIIAPQHMLTSNGPGEGATLDLDQEVFVGVNAPPTEDGGMGLTVQQFAIRTAEHESTALNLVRQIVASSGYSASTFGMAQDAAMTATESDSRDRKSNVTREKKTRYWDNAIADLVEALTAIDVSVFGQGARLRPTVEFAASVQPSQRETAETLDMLRRAKASSTKTIVQTLHPDWDEEAVDAEVALIVAEEGLAVPDLGPLPGDPELPGLPADGPPEFTEPAPFEG